MRYPKFAQYGGVDLSRVPAADLGTRALSLYPSLGAWPAVWIGGALVFHATLTLYSFALYSRSNVVAALTAAAVIACTCLILNGQRHPLLLPVGISCVVAMTCGAALGTLCHHSYSYTMFFYTYSRTYYNVVPNENVAAIADAGRVDFVSGTRVDVSSSVGYATEDGQTYCIAPVREQPDSRDINFWAVGTNCCSLVGGFNCDAASDPNAHGGIVLFDGPHSLLTPSTHHFERARKKAAAVFGLNLVDSPMFVRWVTTETLIDLTAHLGHKVRIFIVAATVLYAGLSLACVWAARSSWAAFAALLARPADGTQPMIRTPLVPGSR